MFTVAVDEGVTCGVTPEYDVCATLNSEYDGWSLATPGAAFAPNFIRAGEYVIGFCDLDCTAAVAADFDKKGNFTGRFLVSDITESDYAALAGGTIPEMNMICYEVKDGKVFNTNTTECSVEFAAKVNKDFNMAACGLDTCITKKNIKANFGWDDAQEDCFDWSDKGASVVDTECVVAIPKTGDASVLAWLF